MRCGRLRKSPRIHTEGSHSRTLTLQAAATITFRVCFPQTHGAGRKTNFRAIEGDQIGYQLVDVTRSLFFNIQHLQKTAKDVRANQYMFRSKICLKKFFFSHYEQITCWEKKNLLFSLLLSRTHFRPMLLP